MRENKKLVYKVVLKSEVNEEDAHYFPITVQNFIKDTKIKKTFYGRKLREGGSFIFELFDTMELVIIPAHWILFMAPSNKELEEE